MMSIDNSMDGNFCVLEEFLNSGDSASRIESLELMNFIAVFKWLLLALKVKITAFNACFALLIAVIISILNSAIYP